jgi:hypothetical protein
MNQFGIEADKVAAFTLYGAFLPPGYAPDCSGVTTDNDDIIEMKFRDKPFEYIKCRPDYKDGADSNDYAGRYGKRPTGRVVHLGQRSWTAHFCGKPEFPQPCWVGSNHTVGEEIVAITRSSR